MALIARMTSRIFSTGFSHLMPKRRSLCPFTCVPRPRINLPLEYRARSPGDLSENSRTAWKCHGNARPEAQTRAMLGGQHERQEWFVRGFEGPDAIESR